MFTGDGQLLGIRAAPASGTRSVGNSSGSALEPHRSCQWNTSHQGFHGEQLGDLHGSSTEATSGTQVNRATK